MREGASEAERPKLGRPPKADVEASLADNTKSKTEHKSSKNPSVEAHTSASNNNSEHTNQCQQTIGQSERDQPSATQTLDQSERVQPSVTQTHKNRPITSPDSSHSRNRPITEPSARPSRKTAKIQTHYETLSGRAPHPDYLKKGPVITRQMFDQWSPDTFAAAGSSLSVRPVRKTRNQAPQYVDAISPGLSESLESINGQLTQIK